MADDYKKSGQSFHGVKKDQYEQEIHMQDQLNIADVLIKRQQELNEEKKKGTIIDDITSGNYAERLSIAKKLKDFHEDNRDLRKGDLKHSNLIGRSAGKFADQIKNQVPFVSNINDSYKEIKNNYGFLGRFAGPLAAFALLAKLALDFAKNIADTRKELGVSVGTAIKLNAQNKILGIQAKAYGLDVEDVKNAQAAIRDNLGASVDEAASLSLNFARTAAATGQSDENMAKLLMSMESISTASRDVLMNQMRSNAAMIEAAGVTPSLVFDDMAQNMEFFMTYSKESGKNLIEAGIAARKLGMDMSAVKNITESLMDFETSIEASMTASMLLGRDINTDRARMLAITGDQAGLMKEVQRLVGSEADFTAMLAPQREALAKAFGMDVEQLSRMVRNQGPQASGAAAGGAAGKNITITPSSDVESHRLLNKIVRNTE